MADAGAVAGGDAESGTGKEGRQRMERGERDASEWDGEGETCRGDAGGGTVSVAPLSTNGWDCARIHSSPLGSGVIGIGSVCQDACSTRLLNL